MEWKLLIHSVTQIYDNNYNYRIFLSRPNLRVTFYHIIYLYLFSLMVFFSPSLSFSSKNGTGTSDAGGRGNGHPSDNPFYSNIDSMPDIRPRRKSIPLVSELVSANPVYHLINPSFIHITK